MSFIVKRTAKFLIGVLLLFSWRAAVAASMKFSSPSAKLVLQSQVLGSTAGQFQASNADAVIGFSNESLVQQSAGANVPASSWSNSIASDTVVSATSIPQAQTDTNTSSINTLNYLISTTSQAVVTQAALIASLQTELANAGLSAEPSKITGPLYEMSSDRALDANNILHINASTVLDGQGHTISFARNTAAMIRVAVGKTLVLQNVVLQNYQDAAISLGGGANVVFGDGVEINLSDSWYLTRDFVTAGGSLAIGIKVQAGNYAVDLNGYNLRLGSGRFFIMGGMLGGVASGSIVCAPFDQLGNGGSVLALQCTQLALADDFEFTNGAIEIFDTASLTGRKMFTFATNAFLYIAGNSTLTLDSGATFSYAPTVNNRDAIIMEDATSTLALNGCTLKSTTTGMRLTSGRLLVDSSNNIISDARSVSEAICFGDGVSADDLLIDIMPGASLNVTSGILDYQPGA